MCRDEHDGCCNVQVYRCSKESCNIHKIGSLLLKYNIFIHHWFQKLRSDRVDTIFYWRNQQAIHMVIALQSGSRCLGRWNPHHGKNTVVKEVNPDGATMREHRKQTTKIEDNMMGQSTSTQDKGSEIVIGN